MPDSVADPIAGPVSGLVPLRSAEDVAAYLRRIWQEHAVGLVYDGYLHHVRVGTPYGERYGRDEVVVDTVQELAAFPDLRFRAEGTVWSGAGGAEGRGLYVSHLALRAARNTGFSRYGPPTGRRVRYLAATDLLIQGGRVAEVWSVHDGLALTRQLGLSDEAAVRAVAAQHPASSALAPSLHGSGALGLRGQDPPESFSQPLPAEGPGALITWLWHEVWNRRRLDRVGEFYASDYRFHGPSGVRFRTRAAFAAYVLGLLAAFPDAVMRLEHRCQSNDRHRHDRHSNDRRGKQVAVRWRLLGTHDGPGRYGPPTGRRIDVLGVTHYRLRGERLAGECTVFDELALLAQLRAPHYSEETRPDPKPERLKPDDPATAARQGRPSAPLEE